MVFDNLRKVHTNLMTIITV